MTHWQCPGIPINYIYWASDAPGYPEQKGMPHTIVWGQFADQINKFQARCDWCGKGLDQKEIPHAIRTSHTIPRWICGECQQKEMEEADRDTRQDDLKSQWMEEKYGYLRDEQ